MSDPRNSQPKVYLASASPRRAKLLRDAGIEFEQVTPVFDEDAVDVSALEVGEATRHLAFEKAASLRHAISDGIMITCDTLLSLDGSPIGKPANAEDAEGILSLLAGHGHEVVTSVCIIDLRHKRHRLFTDTATVTIGDISQTTLDAYIEGGEWQGKAGGYNYAELADRWPITVEGDPDTVIGVPVRRLKDELACMRHPVWDSSLTGGRGSARAIGLNAPLEERLGRSLALPKQSLVLPKHDAIMSGTDCSLRAKLLRVGGLIGEVFYLPAVNWRNKLYDMGWKRAAKAKLPVVSVGNITAGGTGKTPMVMHIVRLLQKHGHRPAIILRGYRSTAEHGSDEAALYKQELPGVPVIINADRVAAAKHAVELSGAGAGVTVLVLDDAFQHRRIARDFDLVLLDASNPFGYGHVLPRGLLREPVENLARADAVVLTHVEMCDYNDVSELDNDLYEIIEPAAWFAHTWSQVLDSRDAPVVMQHQRVLAFCGIGNPAGFLAEAKQRFEVIQTAVFADHHSYSADDVTQLQKSAKAADAAALLTTEKDWVKVRAVIQSAPLDLPVWRPQLSLTAVRGGDELERMLMEHIGSPPALEPPHPHPSPPPPKGEGAKI